jgi:hypothetical protein
VPSLTPTLAASPTDEINCPDKNRIELFVRASGRVKVNQTVMLERPAAAGETDYKRIRYLIEKERILILDGPICFNGNTWWKFKTESSDSGWSPELDSSGKRLLILDSP